MEQETNIEEYQISDINKGLIGIYQLIQNDPSQIIETYKIHHGIYNSKDVQWRKDYFKIAKHQFNENKNPADLYFIMRTTTNGMPRYNKQGNFNNSCHFSRPGMNPLDVEKLIIKYNKLFNSKKITFECKSYKETNPNMDSILYCDPPYFQTKGMYFDNFDNQEFIDWINNLDCKWMLSYDGKINDESVSHCSPKYKRHEYLVSGNSSFRRYVSGKHDQAIISESLYLNF